MLDMINTGSRPRPKHWYLLGATKCMSGLLVTCGVLSQSQIVCDQSSWPVVHSLLHTVNVVKEAMVRLCDLGNLQSSRLQLCIYRISDKLVPPPPPPKVLINAHIII
jgi:hypothetical protein